MSMETTVKTAEFDLQAGSFDEMFRGLVDILPHIYVETPNGVEHIKSQVKEHISWAKKHLKKKDRMVWYLRWVRLFLFAQVCGGDEKLKDRYLRPEIAHMRKFTDGEIPLAFLSNSNWLPQLQQNLDHFLSLPVAEIQSIVFDKQLAPNLMQEFKKLEKEWQATTSKLLKPYDDDEIIIQFPDGWAWWKLGRSYCAEEAKAMGHCGNVAGQYRTEERILSLRRPVKAGAETRWEPHLTFIIDPDGYLGEMKGRSNQKPAARYHPYIIALLERTDIVTDMVGGGHKPSQNFSLNDLTAEQQKQVRAVNPLLVTAQKRLDELGGTPDRELVERINRGNKILGDYDPQLNGWVNGAWSNPGQFIKHEVHGDAVLDYQIFAGEMPEYEWAYNIIQRVRNTVEALPEADAELILTWLSQRGVSTEGTAQPKPNNRLWSILSRRQALDGKEAEAVEPARLKLWEVWKSGITPQMRKEIGDKLRRALESAWYGTRNLALDPDNFWGGEVKAVTTANSAAQVADGDTSSTFAEEDEDGEGGYDANELSFEYYGYQTLNNHNNKSAWDVSAASRTVRVEFSQGSIAFPTEDEAARKAKSSSVLFQKDATFELIAANYEEMFKTLLTPQIKSLAQAETGGDWIGTAIKNEIAWAKEKLRKQDRIIWYLRWFRLSVLGEVTRQLHNSAMMMKRKIDDEQVPELTPEQQTKLQAEIAVVQQPFDAMRAYMNEELKAMSTRTGQPIHGGPGMQWFPRQHQYMEHYLSLPAPEIQTLVWNKQTPPELDAQLKALETAWQAEAEGKLGIQEGDEVFIQFPDGWAWWLLSRSYCSEEGRAMGHCGNVVGQTRTDERILSLRKPLKRRELWEPHATFILEPNGYLGEMKGRGNKKPEPQYHKYIIGLLEDPRIKGIRGGGHLPAENFDLSDLPTEQQEALVNKNPNLGAMAFQLRKHGISDDLINRVQSTLWPQDDVTEPPAYDKTLGGFVTESWGSIDDLVKDKGNDIAKSISEQSTNGFDFDYIENMDLKGIIDALNADQAAMLKKYLMVACPKEVRAWSKQFDPMDKMVFEKDVDLNEFIEEYDPLDVKQGLYRAAETAARHGAEKIQYEALERAVRKFGYVGTGETIDLPTNDSSGRLHLVWDSPVQAYLTLEAAAKLADRGEPFSYYENSVNERGDTGIDVPEPHYGWSEWDDNSFDEMLKEEFSQARTPEEQAAEYKKLEAEAKKRPDLIAHRDNGRITGWSNNPNYKGPKLGPGGVPWDEATNSPLKKQPRKKAPDAKRKKKRRAAMIAAADTDWMQDEHYFSRKYNELLAKLKALPYASEIVVFGSSARGKEKPSDIDLVIDLRGKGSHSAWVDFIKLSKEYYGQLDPFILADNGIADGKPIYRLWVRNDSATGWVPSRNHVKMWDNIKQQGIALTAVQPIVVEPSVKKATGDKPRLDAHRSGTIMWIDWMWVPLEMRDKGMGRSIYMAWEEKLPPDITLLRLQAAADSPAADFWEKMGFSYMYDVEMYNPEMDNQMWKGVNGHPTPEPLNPHEDEDEMGKVSDDQSDFAKSFPDATSFLEYHNTGYIDPKHYENMDFNWEKSKFPKLLKSLTLRDGTQVELRQEGRPNKYVKTDENDSIIRDEQGLATYLSLEEMQQRGLALEDTAIFAFVGDQCVGYASDEFGADGLWVAPTMQRRGLGLELITEFRKQFKGKRQMGQMTPAGQALTKKYYDKMKSSAQKWYHGTSVKAGQEIMKDGYLRPGMPTIYVTELRPRVDAVYITKDYKAARNYARKTDGDGMVIEVQVTDLGKLMPDEDTINIALTMTLGNYARQPTSLETKIRTVAEEMAVKRGASLLAGPSESGWDEQAKDVAEYIYRNHPTLSRQIVQRSKDAAYVGALKVVNGEELQDRELDDDYEEPEYGNE